MWMIAGRNTYLAIHEHALPFQDLHYVYALARAGGAELVNEMVFSMQACQSVALYPKPGLRWRYQLHEYGCACGRLGKAITELRPTLPRLYQIGGSHAQRDLFEQVYLNAWLLSKTMKHFICWKSALQRVVISPQFSVDWP